MTEPVTWRTLLADATDRLADRAEARRIVEEATGHEGAELSLVLDREPTRRTLAHFDSMVERRAAGEPLQYVLGRWGFRALDVHVDRRVLIPRPETEIVVEHALQVIDAIDARTVVDLGTGSGVIALSIACERSRVNVWATDASVDALNVARANLAGIGRCATRVRIEQGDWFDALPSALAGTIDVLVSNPPYVAAGDPLPAAVADWEPRAALVSGPTGVEAIEHILVEAPRWLARPGAVVLEIGETQSDQTRAACRAFTSAEIHPDLTGRPRVLVARLE